MADDIREARRLAKLVYGQTVNASAGTSAVTGGAVAKVVLPWAGEYGGCEVFAPTRRAALAGLCAALRAMTGEGGK